MIAKPQKIPIAHLPTPIEDFSRLRSGLWVKRDDFSGCELSGNKVRKLEYLVAEAIAHGADTLITAGDVQSNHARATAVVAARLGLRSLLVLEGHAVESDWSKGNAFIDRFVGAEIDWQEQEGFVAQRLDAAAERLRRAGPSGGAREVRPAARPRARHSGHCAGPGDRSQRSGAAFYPPRGSAWSRRK